MISIPLFQINGSLSHAQKLKVSLKEKLVNTGSEAKAESKDVYVFILDALEPNQMPDKFQSMLRSVIRKSAMGHLGRSVFEKQPVVKQDQIEVSQISAIIKIEYQLQDLPQGKNCKVYLKYLSLPSIQNHIKNFLQIYLVKTPNDKLGFSFNQQAFKKMKKIKAVLNNGLGQYFELMQRIYQYLQDAYNRLRNYWTQEGITLMKIQKDQYPQQKKYYKCPWYRLVKRSFAKDHCFFANIQTLIKVIYTDTSEMQNFQKLNQKVIQNLNGIIKVQRLKLQENQGRFNAIKNQIFHFSLFYRLILRRQQYEKIFEAFFRHQEKQLYEIINFWEKETENTKIIRQYVSSNVTGIFSEIKQFFTQLTKLDVHLIQDMRQMKISSAKKIPQFQNIHFSVIWQRFKSYSWMGIFQFLLSKITDCLVVNSSKSNEKLIGQDVLITSHQKFISILTTVCSILNQMEKAEIYNCCSLRSFYSSLLEYINSEVNSILCYEDLLDLRYSQRVVLLLVNLYANIKILEIGQVMPIKDTHQIIQDIVQKLKLYKRTKDKKQMGAQFIDLKFQPTRVQEIYDDLCQNKGDNLQQLERVSNMITEICKRLVIIGDSKDIDRFINIVLFLEDSCKEQLQEQQLAYLEEQYHNESYLTDIFNDFPFFVPLERQVCLVEPFLIEVFAGFSFLNLQLSNGDEK